MTSTTSKPCGCILRSVRENWKPPLTENRVDIYLAQLAAVIYGDIYHADIYIADIYSIYTVLAQLAALSSLFLVPFLRGGWRIRVAINEVFLHCPNTKPTNPKAFVPFRQLFCLTNFCLSELSLTVSESDYLYIGVSAILNFINFV